MFRKVIEVFILVFVFFGFKGNLEMILVFRLFIVVNIGKMDLFIEKWNLIIGNLVLK